MDRRTLTMNWDGLGEDDDDDRFFESRERLSTAVPLDLASSGSDEDDNFEDSRLSFASAISSASINRFHGGERPHQPSLEDYGMWMAEPGDINQRRKRLLQGMGLASHRDLLKLASTKIVRAVSRKAETTPLHEDPPPPKAVADSASSPQEELKQEPSPSIPILLVRSRSDGDIETFSVNTKKRKEEIIGPVSKQRLTRTSSGGSLTPSTGICQYANSIRVSPKRTRDRSSTLSNRLLSSALTNSGIGSFFLIKNLDTGKEFIVKEYNEEGMWNKLSDLQTGKQLTMDEFEKSVGYSPVVKELMRREHVSRIIDDDRKINLNSYLSKSMRYSKRRGVAFLKNIKGVANSMSGLVADKEREHPSQLSDQKSGRNSSQWIKVRQHGRSYKEFTGLHLCQEIQAHEGSIWTIKFNSDARYLASAGEDRVIHVWEVQECEVMSNRLPDDMSTHSYQMAALAASTCASPVHPLAASASVSPVHPMAASPVHPMANSVLDYPSLADIAPLPSEKKKKGENR